MAEAFLKQLSDDKFEAESAGIEKGTLCLNIIIKKFNHEYRTRTKRNRKAEV
jgi:protein-tyrosine-phosphatase